MASLPVFVLRIFHLLNLAHWIWGAVVVSQSTEAKSFSPNIWAYAVTDTVLHALCFGDILFATKKEARTVESLKTVVVDYDSTSKLPNSFNNKEIETVDSNGVVVAAETEYTETSTGSIIQRDVRFKMTSKRKITFVAGVPAFVSMIWGAVVWATVTSLQRQTFTAAFGNLWVYYQVTFWYAVAVIALTAVLNLFREDDLESDRLPHSGA